MRQYNILSGKNKGIHYIFDDEKEYNESEQFINKAVNWRDGDIKQWVFTDDGRIVQILNIYLLGNGKSKYMPRYIYNKTTQNWIGTKCVKVCFGVFNLYGKKNGDIISQKMLAEPFRMEEFKKNRVSITAENTVLGKYLTKRKKMFVYYLFQTGNPVFALKMVLPKNLPFLAKQNLVHNAIELTKDEFVVKELNTYMNNPENKASFREKLRIAFEAEELNAENYAKEVKLGIEQAKKGSLAHNKWVETYGKLLAFAEGDENSNRELLPDEISKAVPAKIEYQTSEEQVLLPPPSVKS